MDTSQVLTQTALVGIGATAVLDLWLAVIARLGVPFASFGLIGRWVGHMPAGQFAHASIARAEAVRYELGLGWATHYAVGVLYAALLVALQGVDWLEQPTYLPALAMGVATVAMPWCVMQPAMGSGFAAMNTPTPLKNCIRSLTNHAVFGTGLYLAAAVLSRIAK